MQYISPSNFVANQKCPARSYLNRKSQFKINRSAQSYFGSFCHLFMDKSSSLFYDRIPSKKELKEYWELEFENYCNDLLQRDSKFYLKYPLKSFLSDYLIVRATIINKLLQRTHINQRQSTSKINNELRLNVDGISASIDLVYRNESYVKLVDFKFGKIFDENSQVKEPYQKQLYIYSAMYYLEFGIEPSVLAISDKGFKEYKIEKKSMNYCLNLFNELKQLNDKIGTIKSEKDISKYAMPSEDNCKYCNVKIDCSSFWKSGLYESENHLDIIGEISDMKNGVDGIVVYMKTSLKGDIKVFKIPSKMESELKKVSNIAFFKLFKRENTNDNNFYYGRYSDAVLMIS